MIRFFNLLILPIKVALMPFSIAPIVGAAIIAGAASVLNGISQYATNKENREAQEEINSQNLAFQREQFNEQKYLNRNQYQLTASDMQKAGMNPVLMSGANLTAGNYNSELQAPKAIAPQIDIGAISQLASVYSSNKTQKQIADDSNDTQIKIAADKNKTDLQIAELQSKTQQEIASAKITQEDRQFQQKLAQDFSIANIEAELKRRGIESNEAIEASKRVSEQLKRNDDYQVALENIRLEEQKIKNAKTAAEKDAAVRSANGWKSFAASLFHTVVNAAISVVTGKPTPGSSNPIGFTAN